MLTPSAPLRQLNIQDALVVADTSSGVISALLARTLLARNPLITKPPIDSKIWESAGDASAAAGLRAQLESALADPFFVRPGAEPEKGANRVDPVYSAWLLAVANMAMTGILSYPQRPIREIKIVKDSLATLADEQTTSLSTWDITTVSIEAALEKDAIRVPFAKVILSMAYDGLLKSGFFSALPQSEVSFERNQTPLLERGLLLTTLLRTLAIQTLFPRIRPILRYLRHPLSRIRLLQEFEPTRLEYLESIMDRVLGVPVHPWIAATEEASIPMNRNTPWGPSTPSILLERGTLDSTTVWDGRGQVTTAQRIEFANQMKAKLDPVMILDRIDGQLKEWKRLLIELDNGGRFAKVANQLGFTLPTRPLAVPLYGEAFRPIYFDGLNASEPISNLIEASYQPTFPAQGGHVSPWIGEEALVPYNGRDRINGNPSMWSEYTGLVSVAPEDIVMDTSFQTNRFSPEMIKFRADAYKGDPNAMMFKATVDNLRQLQNLELPELIERVRTNPAGWAHLLTLEGTTLKATRPEEMAFYSDRTRMTWLTEIYLPRTASPTVMWLTVRGEPRDALPVISRFIRDTDIPQTSVPLDGAVDSLVRLAISAKLGATK